VVLVRQQVNQQLDLEVLVVLEPLNQQQQLLLLDLVDLAQLQQQLLQLGSGLAVLALPLHHKVTKK
jgi:hypothetical protein